MLDILSDLGTSVALLIILSVIGTIIFNFTIRSEN